MERVLKYLNQLLKEKDTIVLAISGGPDSMCLLHLMCELKSLLDLKIICAHVNHKLRQESLEEALFVQNTCQKYHLIYEYMEINKYESNSIEVEARLKRYTFFDEVMQKYNGKYLMTAHHGDDLIETILMRLTRGSSLKGYSGFKKEYLYHNYYLIRPLIELTKNDILNYMDSHNYSYYIDKSNYSNKYTRNRYRKHVLPFLKQEEPQVHLKYLKFSQELIEANTYIDKTINNTIQVISDKNGIKIDELLKLEPFIIKKIIENTLSNIYTDDLFLISDRHTQMIILMLKNSKANNKIDLPGHYQAIKSYNYYKIEKINNNTEYEYILKDKVILPNKSIIKIIKETNNNSNNVIYLNSQDITLPIIIRSRRNGDKMAVKNLNGHKKIKDILIDEKIPKEKRKIIPIVTDSQNNILWLPGIKKSKFDAKTTGIYDIILAYEEEKDER